MEKKIGWYIEKGLLVRTPFIRKLSPKFLEKARNNLITMNILFEMQDKREIREALDIPREYDSAEWVVACGYYAMYMAALAALAQVGYRSRNHSGTILALEAFFVKKELLEPKYLEMIGEAQFGMEHVEQIRWARERREIAQYSVTKHTTKRLASESRDDAYEFVERMEKLLER
ncbi:HEPN domain-containing protein [Candidatus Micrarchaeota archaeon]|nr:HEPN domain-containing protein [Candidatus Micrarchaeota archaeon]